jgi:hypothetical protein
MRKYKLPEIALHRFKAVCFIVIALPTIALAKVG